MADFGKGLMMNDGPKKRPTIFLLEEDDETRRPLVSNLHAYGYRVVVAVDEEDALERVGGVDADLLLVNLVGRGAVAQQGQPGGEPPAGQVQDAAGGALHDLRE